MSTVAAKLRSELARLSDAALRDALIERLRGAIAEIAPCRPEEVRIDWVNPNPMLLWLTLQPYTVRNLGFALLPFDVPHCHSIVQLATHLAGELRMPPPPTAPMGELYQPGFVSSGPVEWRYDEPIERPIVFLLTAPRSGSTLLSAMLGKHPQLYAAGELTLLPFESMGARKRHFGIERSWVRIGLFAAIKELSGMTEEEAEDTCLAFEAQDLPVSVVYRRLQELAGSRILVDKSPYYASHPAWLATAERAFRVPRYIHLTRHPGAAIESFVRRRLHRLLDQTGPAWDENPWLFAEKVWTSYNLHCLRFLQDVDPARQLRISYEALVSDPATAVAQLCEFLQIPLDAGPLEPYGGGSPRILGMGDVGLLGHTGIEAALATTWQHAKPPQSFGRLTREVAETLGYPLA